MAENKGVRIIAVIDKLTEKSEKDIRTALLEILTPLIMEEEISEDVIIELAKQIFAEVNHE